MPFLIPRAPVRNGRVKSLRARAAVEEAERMGSPAVCWLKRSGWERGGAVVQPYFTPRLVMRGRRDSGRRKEGGICAQLVGSLGAMLFGLGWKLIWRFGSGWGRGENLISFAEENGEQPMIFFHGSKYPAARLTISSKLSDLIPKNILLPFQEDTRLVSFQIDNLDSFAIDFDVFPTYGAKVIAKTVALPSTFRALESSSGRCCLPLFDPRLRAIGQITFNFQVIKPFQGKPLEITDFETYWKATSQFDSRPSAFITGSSLSGDYVQLFVQHTCDGVPVLWPSWNITYNAIEFPVCRLTYAQFLSAGSGQNKSSRDLSALPGMPLANITEIHDILAASTVSLEDALSLLPKGMHVNLQILYPTLEEENVMQLSPTVNINAFGDAILKVVFDHARTLREQSPDAMRSIVFSSYNHTICTTLNWKQPNYPVFLCNDLGREWEAGQQLGVEISGRRTTSIKESVRVAKSNNFMGLICCSRLLVCFLLLEKSISPTKSHLSLCFAYMMNDLLTQIRIWYQH